MRDRLQSRMHSAQEQCHFPDVEFNSEAFRTVITRNLVINLQKSVIGSVQLALLIACFAGTASYAAKSDDLDDVAPIDVHVATPVQLASNGTPASSAQTIHRHANYNGFVEQRKKPGFFASLNPLHGTERRLHALQVPLNNLSATISPLQQPLDQLKDPIKELKEPLSNLTDPINNLNKPIQGLQAPVNNLNQTVGTLRRPIEGLQAPITQLQKPVNDLVRSTTVLNQPLNNVASQLSSVNKPLVTLAQPISDLKQPLTGIATPLQGLQTPLTGLKEPIHNLSPSIDHLSEEIGTLHQEISTLRSLLNDAIKNICLAICFSAAFIGTAIWTKRTVAVQQQPQTVVFHNDNPTHHQTHNAPHQPPHQAHHPQHQNHNNVERSEKSVVGSGAGNNR